MKIKLNFRTFTRAITVVSVLFVSAGTALADQFDDQIAALKAQAAQQQNAASNLHAQADDYRSKVAQLQSQINALQIQINLNQAQLAKVNNAIAQNSVKLAQQRDVLSANIKSMYLNSAVSPIEMLASNNNFSDFLDQQQYQDKIKTKIQDAMASIQLLQKQLEAQKNQVNQLLATAQAQQSQLAANQAQVNQLLATAAQNAAAADEQVRNSNAQIGSLKAQQAAVLAARFGNSGLTSGGQCAGGYPARWCNAAQDTVIDNWGMFNRECVSYTAFKVAVSGRTMPYWGGHGNANQWPSSAEASGIPVDGNPHAGDVAISMAGPYGHAMYVEGVFGGQIHVSQYNYGNRGEYSEMTISASGLYFIHFR
jgi:surface antigen